MQGDDGDRKDEDAFPLVKVQGSSYEMGCQHGEKCAQLIKDHLAILFRNLQQNGTPKEKALAYAKQSIDFAASYAPHLVEELNGIADGAKVSREEIYYLNSSHPKTYDGCTTFVVFPERTQDGTVIATQNIDNGMSSRTIKRGIILHMVPDSGP
jgi:isopenicillin-N N-acyltransferase-like protein